MLKFLPASDLGVGRANRRSQRLAKDSSCYPLQSWTGCLGGLGRSILESSSKISIFIQWQADPTKKRYPQNSARPRLPIAIVFTLCLARTDGLSKGKEPFDPQQLEQQRMRRSKPQGSLSLPKGLLFTTKMAPSQRMFQRRNECEECICKLSV